MNTNDIPALSGNIRKESIIQDKTYPVPERLWSLPAVLAQVVTEINIDKFMFTVMTLLLIYTLMN